MTTTINILQNDGPSDEGYGPGFPSSAGEGMGARVLRESSGPNKSAEPRIPAKKFIKAAEGKSSKGKKKVKKGSKPENLRASEAKNKKKGMFGETYKAPAGNKSKGIRVAESGRFRESVSVEDLRGMLQRALREEYPPPKQNYPGEVPSCGIGGDYSSPWIEDIIPDEHLVVFKMKEVLWGADYNVNERSGKASLSNIRRVESKYVDFSNESEDDED